MSTPYQPYPQTAAAEGGQRGYLHGAPVDNPVEAITQAFKHIITYNGRASRSAFWWFFGFFLIVGSIASSLSFVPVLGVILHVVGVFFFFTALSAAARRLHDTDRSGLWLLLILIPIVGWIWLLVYYLQPGTPGPNQHDDQYA